MANMNAGIILGGNALDPIGALARGQTARARADQYQSQNALRNLYQTQGAQIMSGDQGALNALAQLDPAQAMQMRNQKTRMQQQTASHNQQTAQRTQTMKLQMQKYVDGLSKEQAAAEAAQLEQGVTRAIGFYQAGDLNGLNQLLTSVGEQPLQSLEQFPAVAALYGDALTALKSVEQLTAPDKPADEYGRYAAEERAAGREPLSRIGFKRATQKTQNLKVGADNSVSLTEGFGGSDVPPKLTVDAGKNTGFLIRLNDSGEILNNLESEGLSFFQQNSGAIPFDLGNYLVSKDFQRFDQARRDFVNAILRRESGAVISEEEFANAEKQYFPVPGDNPEVIAQKRKNRENAIAGVRAGAGDGAGYVDAMQQQTQQATQEIPVVAPEYLNTQDAELWDYMLPEERGAILQTYRGQ